MHLAAHLAALIAVVSAGVVYGTDVFCALVQRPALARVDDTTLTSVMGNVHRFGDRRLRLPGIVGMLASAAAFVLAALADRPVASATAGTALALLVGWLLLYRRVQRADQPRPRRRRRQPRDAGQRAHAATRLGPRHRAPGSAARPGRRRAVREPHQLTGVAWSRRRITTRAAPLASDSSERSCRGDAGTGGAPRHGRQHHDGRRHTASADPHPRRTPAWGPGSRWPRGGMGCLAPRRLFLGLSGGQGGGGDRWLPR